MDRAKIQVSSTDYSVNVSIGTQYMISTNKITVGAWTQLIIRFSNTAGSTGTTVARISFGSIGDNFLLNGNKPAIPTASTDVFRVGGFVGEVKELLIFSPSGGGVNARISSDCYPFY